MKYRLLCMLLVFQTTQTIPNEIELKEKLSSLDHSLGQLSASFHAVPLKPSKKPSQTLTKINDTTYKFQNTEIRLIIGNIVAQTGIDVIVNAANQAGILPTGVEGVAAAILSALTEQGRVVFNQDVKTRYPKLIEWAEENLGQAFLGKILATTPLGQKGYKYLINAVGPACNTGEDVNYVVDAYRNSLIEANKVRATSIIFPRISAIIFGCDADTINKMAIDTTLQYLKGSPTTSLKTVYFVFFGGQPKDLKALDEYKKILCTYSESNSVEPFLSKPSSELTIPEKCK